MLQPQLPQCYGGIACPPGPKFRACSSDVVAGVVLESCWRIWDSTYRALNPISVAVRGNQLPLACTTPFRRVCFGKGCIQANTSDPVYLLGTVSSRNHSSSLDCGECSRSCWTFFATAVNATSSFAARAAANLARSAGPPAGVAI